MAFYTQGRETAKQYRLSAEIEFFGRGRFFPKCTQDKIGLEDSDAWRVCQTLLHALN